MMAKNLKSASFDRRNMKKIESKAGLSFCFAIFFLDVFSISMNFYRTRIRISTANNTNLHHGINTVHPFECTHCIHFHGRNVVFQQCCWIKTLDKYQIALKRCTIYHVKCFFYSFVFGYNLVSCSFAANTTDFLL